MLEIRFLLHPFVRDKRFFRDFDDRLCLKFAFYSIPLFGTRDFLEILMTTYAWNSLFAGPLCPGLEILMTIYCPGLEIIVLLSGLEIIVRD